MTAGTARLEVISGVDEFLYVPEFFRKMWLEGSSEKSVPNVFGYALELRENGNRRSLEGVWTPISLVLPKTNFPTEKNILRKLSGRIWRG